MNKLPPGKFQEMEDYLNFNLCWCYIGLRNRNRKGDLSA